MLKLSLTPRLSLMLNLRQPPRKKLKWRLMPRLLRKPRHRFKLRQMQKLQRRPKLTRRQESKQRQIHKLSWRDKPLSRHSKRQMPSALQMSKPLPLPWLPLRKKESS